MLYDDNGHLEQDTRDNGGVFVISHNTHQRNIGILANGVAMANYQHNALGQRIVKTTTNNSVIYHYDEAGQLIGESDQAGNVLEYVYVDTMRIARYDGQTAYYYHNDHLNRPIAITDSGKAIVWQADYTPFGLRTLVNSTADNDLGFPGQILDEESSFYYNYFRDYDPGLGRYIQSDPIGLQGGVNTFAYVRGNPILRYDPHGLVDYVNAAISTGGIIFGGAEAAAGGFGIVVNSALVGTGFGAPVGVPGWVGSSALVAHGTYNVLDGYQGLMNAINETNHAGPLSQFGQALFGAPGAEYGKVLDTALSVRGALTSGKGFIDGLINGGAKASDAHGVISTGKKYYDSHGNELNYCPI